MSSRLPDPKCRRFTATNVVYGPFTLKGGKLTFQAGSGVLAYDARQAMDAGVELIKGAKPLRYKIVMRVQG